MNSKSISSLLSDRRINAETTPWPRLVFILAEIFPYPHVMGAGKQESPRNSGHPLRVSR